MCKKITCNAFVSSAGNGCNTGFALSADSKCFLVDSNFPCYPRHPTLFEPLHMLRKNSISVASSFVYTFVLG